MELAPGLHRVGTDLVNIYLIEDDSGVTVIDTGMPGQWPDLLAALAAMGRGLDAVRAVILTHGDSDHVGFAERLRSQTGVPVYVHEADAALAKGEVKKRNPSWGRVRLRPTASFLWFGLRKGGLSSRPVTSIEALHGGETLDLPGRPRIIHTPGHSPGSIAIHSPAVEALFVGDALTTRHVLTGDRGPQPAPFSLDREAALRSIEQWRDIEARWVLPGHGYPWDQGVGSAIDGVLASATT